MAVRTENMHRAVKSFLEKDMFPTSLLPLKLHGTF